MYNLLFYVNIIFLFRFMKAKCYLSLLALLCCLPVLGSQSKLQNVYSRNITSLNGYWQTIVDPLDVGYYDYRMNFNKYGYFKNQQAKSPLDLIQYDFSTEEQLVVPGDWNTQVKEFFFYEGSIWYKKDFTYQKRMTPDCIFILGQRIMKQMFF